MVNQTENDELQSHDKLSAISIGKKKKIHSKTNENLDLTH